jgi:hypothetical protein
MGTLDCEPDLSALSSWISEPNTAKAEADMDFQLELGIFRCIRSDLVEEDFCVSSFSPKNQRYLSH